MIKWRVGVGLRRIRPMTFSVVLHAVAIVVLVNFAGRSALTVATPDALATVLLGPGDVVASMPGEQIEEVEASATAPALLDVDVVERAATAPIQPPGEFAIEPLAEPVEPLEVLLEIAVGPTATEPLSISPEGDTVSDAFYRGGGCNFADHLRARLQTEPGVLDGLAQLPQEARSVANALMMWDGAWVEAATGAASVSQIIRTTIESVVRTAPAACLEMEVTGPNFIILDDARGATVLVVGSGAWRWGDLI